MPAIPERVAARIERHEDDAEVLLRLFQLAIVSLFGSLYLVSPKTDEGTAFALAPYVIGIYFVLTVFGLGWALRARLPDWSVYVSILIDITVLYAMIWSFHLQYEQPASFYLKAPTLLYVFIFIALRAFRFRARFVVATGLTAAIGWIILFVYAMVVDETNNMITRDYVAYITGNFVLIGAEIDKIVSILTVTAILTLVIRRARTTLVQAVTEETAARDLSRFFDANVAAQIRDAEHQVAAGEGMQRYAAILFVDIRGFSILAATLPPNAVMTLLAQYERRLVPVIQSNGGIIDKFMGDGIMATFGALSEDRSHAADALRALDAVMEEAQSWTDRSDSAEMAELNVNASVAVGPVIFGALGDSTRLEYTVIGAPVNLAAKLEKHNKVLGSRAVTTAEAYDAALAQGYQPPGDPVRQTSQIEGIDDPVEIVVLHQ
ncbi:MAG: adenylate/guanylate cyclase domain-containing protein [Rhizobiales bacterium]|nr:adenylate/guanylate cyclase domain-containing protein [Hyphomicrobiales bacterium]